MKKTIEDLQRGDFVMVDAFGDRVKAEVIDIVKNDANSINGFWTLYLYSRKKLFKGTIEWYIDRDLDEETGGLTDMLFWTGFKFGEVLLEQVEFPDNSFFDDVTYRNPIEL